MSMEEGQEVVENFLLPVPFFSSIELTYAVEPSLRAFATKQDIKLIDLDDVRNKKKAKHVVYKLNNVGQRSEDFYKLDKNKTNVLFAGCSVTFGEHLPDGYSWPNHVYEYLKSNIANLGPMQVVSYPGGNAVKIISNIFKYIYNYGKPDYIFLMLPDMFRLYIAFDDGSGFTPTIAYADGDDIKQYMKPFRNMYEFQNMYRMLETLCKLLDIKLFGTSWETLANKKISALDFKTYKPIPRFGLISEAEKLIDTLSGYDKKFFISAADDMHPGLVTHLAYGLHFIERLKDDKEN